MRRYSFEVIWTGEVELLESALNQSRFYSQGLLPDRQMHHVFWGLTCLVSWPQDMMFNGL